MNESDFSEVMAELQESAAALSRESETIPDIIAAVEARLRDLALDLEVWLDDDPLSVRELSVSASNVAPHVALELGFAPARAGPNQTWSLQLREAEYAARTESPDDHGGKPMRILVKTLLVDAPREDRLRAVAKLPGLLRAYTRATRERIDVIRSARELLDRS